MNTEPSSPTRLELQLVATMSALSLEDPDGLLRIQRAYHAFMEQVRGGFSEIVVEPADMVRYLNEESELDPPDPDDEFGDYDYTIPESQMRRLRLA